MEKKNTMLLTVIAVATLLVAVVGATFAYYSVTATNLTNTYNLNTTTEKAGTITLTTNANDLYLNVTAAQMSEDLKGTGNYYAITTDGDAVTTAQTHTIATITSSGGEDDTKYSCTFTMNVTTTDALDALVNNDADITFAATGSQNNSTTLIGATGDTGVLGKKFVKATTVSGGVNYSGTVQFTGNQTATITAQEVFHNTTAEQNDIAQTAMTTTITFSNFVCKTVASFS